MNKFLKILSYILVAALASLTTLILGFLLPQSRNVNKLEQLGDLIDACYIGEANRTALEDAAARAMIDALGDRWSYYIPAAEYQAYREQMENAYVGVGITIQADEETEGFRIMEVKENGPAHKAGILPGDILIRADGTDLRGMNSDEIGTLVKGESGTTVKLTVLRSGEEKEFSVTRKEVQTVVATAQMLEGSIGLVTIENFDERCAEETIAAVDRLLDQGAVALIFDVRNNPGGYAKELVKVLDHLLPEGELFRTVDYRGQESVDRSDADCVEVPMAVLVNGNSYSAAEFFAAALSDYDAALVVGEKTSGKGYFQNNFRLSDGSAVSLSIGKYFTPGGVSLEGVGITPDVPVEVDEQTGALIYYGTLAPEEDPQIQAAVEALKN